MYIIQEQKMSFIGPELYDTDILILSSLARNGARKVVMDDVGISDRALRNHLNKLGTLFKANNDIEIVLAAIKAGFIDLNGTIL